MSRWSDSSVQSAGASGQSRRWIESAAYSALAVANDQASSAVKTRIGARTRLRTPKMWWIAVWEDRRRGSLAPSVYSRSFRMS